MAEKPLPDQEDEYPKSGTVVLSVWCERGLEELECVRRGALENLKGRSPLRVKSIQFPVQNKLPFE